MTIKEIAVFKSFIVDNTLRDLFIRHYRKDFAYAKNPESIEEYLLKVEYTRVLKDAIKTFSTNSTFGYDFWTNLQDNWLIFYKRMTSGHSYNNSENLQNLEGMFRILRENWDARKPWLYESVYGTLKRLGIKNDSVKEELREPDELEETEEVIENADNEEFEFIELTPHNNAKLASNEFTLNFRNNGYKLTCNLVCSKNIRKKKLEYVRLAVSKNNNVIIQFNNTTGIKIAPNKENNVNVNSKVLCTKIKSLLNIPSDYCVLEVNCISESPDYINYIITKK